MDLNSILQLYGKFGPFFLCTVVLKDAWFRNKSAMNRPHVVPQFMFRFVPTVALTAGDSSGFWLCHERIPPWMFAGLRIDSGVIFLRILLIACKWNQSFKLLTNVMTAQNPSVYITPLESLDESTFRAIGFHKLMVPALPYSENGMGRQTCPRATCSCFVCCWECLSSAGSVGANFHRDASRANFTYRESTSSPSLSPAARLIRPLLQPTCRRWPRERTRSAIPISRPMPVSAGRLD